MHTAQNAQRPTLYADVNNLRKELEQLARHSRPTNSQRTRTEKHSTDQSAAMVIQGK